MSCRAWIPPAFKLDGRAPLVRVPPASLNTCCIAVAFSWGSHWREDMRMVQLPRSMQPLRRGQLWRSACRKRGRVQLVNQPGDSLDVKNRLRRCSRTHRIYMSYDNEVNKRCSMMPQGDDLIELRSSTQQPRFRNQIAVIRSDLYYPCP